MAKLSNEFRNYLKQKKKYIIMYENRQSQFVDGFREKIFKTKSFLTGDKVKDEILYLSLNYARLISHRFADYEIGQGFQVLFGEKENTNKIISWMDNFNIQNKLYRTIVGKSQTGYAVVRVLNVDGVPKFQRIPIEHYSVNVDGLPVGSDWYDIKEHNIISVVVKDEGDKKIRYTHIDNYKLIDGKWIGTYSIFKYDPKFEFKIFDLVAIKGIETLDYLPIFVFNNDIINEGTIGINSKENNPQSIGVYGEYFAESDYVDIMDILQDINDRQSQISVEFIKHLTSKMSLPQTFFDSIKQSQMQDLMKKKKSGEDNIEAMNRAVDNFEYIVHGPGESEAKYLTKDSTMIDKAFKQIDSHIRNIASFTTLPVFMLALEELSGNRHVGTDTTEMDVFLARVEQKRQNYYSTLQRLFAYISYVINSKYEMPTIKFTKFRDYNISEKAETASTLKTNGLMSQQSLIKFVFGYDDKEADEEIAKINQDLVNENAITQKTTNGFLPIL